MIKSSYMNNFNRNLLFVLFIDKYIKMLSSTLKIEIGHHLLNLEFARKCGYMYTTVAKIK